MKSSVPPTPGRALTARATSVLPASSRKQPPSSAVKKFATLSGGLSSSDISAAAAAAAAAAPARSISAIQPRATRAPVGTSNISVVARIRPAKDSGFADGRGRIAIDPLSGRQSIEMQLQAHASSAAAAGLASSSDGRGSWSITPDAVIGPQATQADAYEVVARAHVESVARGENACIMAYGQVRKRWSASCMRLATRTRHILRRQTGSGKTYTMIGGNAEDDRGVLPRAFADLFRLAAERADDAEFSLRVRCVSRSISFLIVARPAHCGHTPTRARTAAASSRCTRTRSTTFSRRCPCPRCTARRWNGPGEEEEETRSNAASGQLNPIPHLVRSSTGARARSLPLRGVDEGVYVDGLSEVPVASVEDAMRKLQPGLDARTTASTAVNCQSSRSHGLISVGVVCSRRVLDSAGRPLAGQAAVRRSVLEIVDLAGSERQKHTAAEGSTLAEASAINGSLSTLARVVAALQARQVNPNTSTAMVPWRDSKLTQLLRRSLSGNSRVMIVGAISASALQWAESVSTLQFLDRARNVRGRPVVVKESRVVTAEAAQRFAEENAALRAELAELRATAGAAGGGAAAQAQDRAPACTMHDDDAAVAGEGAEIAGAVSRALFVESSMASGVGSSSSGGAESTDALQIQSLLGRMQEAASIIRALGVSSQGAAAPGPLAVARPSAALAALVRAKQVQLDAAERQVAELQRLRVDLALANTKLMVLEHERQLSLRQREDRVDSFETSPATASPPAARAPAAAVTAAIATTAVAQTDSSGAEAALSGSKRKRASAEEPRAPPLRDAGAPAASGRPAVTPGVRSLLPPLPASDGAATPTIPTPFLQRLGVGDPADPGEVSAAAPGLSAPASVAGGTDALFRGCSMLSEQPVLVLCRRASAGSSQWGCEDESVGPFRPSSAGSSPHADAAGGAAAGAPCITAAAAIPGSRAALDALRQRAAVEALVAERLADAETALHLLYAESQAAAAEQLCTLVEQVRRRA